MTLQEAETKLSVLNAKINELLKERETVLVEWNTAFNTENPEQIMCIDECSGDCHNLYLVNGESKVQVCFLSSTDMEGSISEFYKRIDTSMGILNITNNKGREIPAFQKNLVYAKAIEIREGMLVRGEV